MESQNRTRVNFPSTPATMPDQKFGGFKIKSMQLNVMALERTGYRKVMEAKSKSKAHTDPSSFSNLCFSPSLAFDFQHPGKRLPMIDKHTSVQIFFSHSSRVIK